VIRRDYVEGQQQQTSATT
jgi:hypothetical protein